MTNVESLFVVAVADEVILAQIIQNAAFILAVLYFQAPSKKCIPSIHPSIF